MSLTIGVLKEVGSESRVAMNSDSVQSLITHTRHTVVVTSGAGEKSNVSNKKYTDAGATILPDNESVIKKADIVVKISKPTDQELEFFREGQVLFCFLNLNSNPNYARKLAKKKITAIGYELIYEEEQKRYPILATMSELVGKISYNIGANLLSIPGSKGVLLGGLGSTSRSKVVIFGGGNAGKAFMKMADNAGSRVVVFEKDLDVAQKINSERPHIETMYPFEGLIKKEIKNADLVFGSTFAGKDKVVRFISEQMLKEMEDKSVIIDLTYESGGISDVTSFKEDNNTFTTTKHNIVHFWQPNIASLVPKTATSALAAPILKYLVLFLLTKQNGIKNSVIDNAIAVESGDIADWIDFDELKKVEYRKEIEHLINNESDEEYDLYQMLNSDETEQEHNLFDKQEVVQDENDNNIQDFLSKNKSNSTVKNQKLKEPNIRRKENNEFDDFDEFDSFNFDDFEF